MILCFNCSTVTKRQIDELLKTHDYTDISEILGVAVNNLFVLHGELNSENSTVIDYNTVRSNTDVIEKDAHRLPADKPNIKRRSMTPPLLSTKNGTTKVASKSRNSNRSQVNTVVAATSTLSIPAIFTVHSLRMPSFTVPSMPDDIWAKGQQIPLDRWIFGQYNKLLPAKANCRALAHLLTKEPHGITLDEAVSSIAKDAVMLGAYLANYDRIHQISRDDAFSTAFPTGDEVEKSMDRYANHFIANVNKNGQVSGLLLDLKLINHASARVPRLQLTEPGWRFAVLKNPILDENPTEARGKFNHDEVEFLLQHILHNVPTEYCAYCVIAKAIQNGANTPDSLDDALSESISLEVKGDVSKSFLSSQRSGAISRMADLGLVERHREGVRVLYAMTTLGTDYTKVG